MAINPYGMSYGIGQMFGGVPDAYNQGTRQAIQQQAQETRNAEQDINLADMQRQHDEAVQLNSELAQSVPDEVTADETTPQDKQAAVLEWHANNMANSGYGKLAQAQRDQAMKLRQDALAMQGQKAAQKVMTGDYDGAAEMLKAAHILAGDGKIENDPDDTDNIILTNNGSKVSMQRYLIAAVAAGDKKIWQIAGQAKNVETRESGKTAREELKLKTMSGWKDMDNKTKLEIERMRQAGANGRASMAANTRIQMGPLDTVVYRDLLKKGLSTEDATNAVYGLKADLAAVTHPGQDPELAKANATAKLFNTIGIPKDPEKLKRMTDAIDAQYSNVKPRPTPQIKMNIPSKHGTLTGNGQAALNALYGGGQ